MLFYGVMLDILILQKIIQEKWKIDKKTPERLDYSGIKFLVKEKDFHKIEIKNDICINVFSYENGLIFPIYLPNKKFEDSMDLLLLIDDDKLHYVYIKDFNRFTFHKTKNNNKRWICKNCLQCFTGENILIKHKEDCLSINGVQSVGVEQGIIEFQNYFIQLTVPLKIYADFECN